MIGPDVVALIGPGNSLVIGTVGADGAPRATRAWSAVVLDAEARRIRVVMTADDPESVINLANGPIALTGCDVRSLRSVQVKGHVVAIDPPTAEDLANLEHHTDLFFQYVHETDGNEISLLRRLLPHDVVVVELVADEVYDQSPGPTAGAVLAARRTP